MSFTSPSYLLFLPVTIILYYILPKRMQNTLLLLASAVFYWFNLPRLESGGRNYMPLVLIAATTVFVYYIALAIDKASGKKRTMLTAFAVIAMLCVLAIFKYSGYFIKTFFAPHSLSALAFPLGISYYTFACVAYIIDVSRRDIIAERGFIRTAVFVSFFATITCGPICRAGKLLPQLAREHRFNAAKASDALRLALVGFFKQIAVANIIGLFVNVVFKSPTDYSGMVLITAAFGYAFQLYYEFSGFCDIACATAMLFGLEIPQNFKTPYFSTNFSGFWSRWHISLSSWLQDYLFMPLVWSKWTSHIPVLGKKVQSPPMITSVAIVFIVSGFWHGNTSLFVIWGIIQAVYRVSEELLHKYYKKPKKKPPLLLRSFKTCGVFALWSFSLIFFRLGSENSGIGGAIYYITHLFSKSENGFAANAKAIIQTGFYPKNDMMVLLYIAFAVLVLAAAIYMDWYQCFKLKDKHISSVLTKLPLVLRWAVYYGFIGVILVAFIMQSGGYGGNVSFAYGGF
ncbi:MAG: MBOAT family O-acyltransferase [Oscillospiraceae bacterium]